MVTAGVNRAADFGMLNLTRPRMAKILEAALRAASDHPPASVAHHGDRDLDRYAAHGWHNYRDH